MTTLKAATESCMRGFAVICHTTEDTRSESSCCNDLKEEFGRFRIWTGNLGALAKGHSALDWRLRDADVMRATVLSLLEELQNTLELASDLVVHGPTEAFFGAEPTHDDHLPDDISLPSDDELDAISPPESSLSIFIQRIQEQVKDLYKLSFRIRTSALKPARAIHYKEIDATSGLDIFGDCFAPHDKSHVYELFRSLRPHHSIFNEDDDLLVQRFAKANTARRRQFRYWYKHAQKLTATDISEPVVMKEVAVDVQPRQGPVKTYTAPRPRTGTQTSQSHHGKTIFTTTEATFFDPKLDLSSLETQSIISSATTARDLEGKPAELPPPPAAALDGHDFVCPYCFVLCPSPHGQGRAWRKHILQDLQPYLCTQVNCSSADRLYGSRREWLEHEEAQHRRVWVCRFHPSFHFSSQQAFEQHLRDEDHGNVTETQIKDFASIAQSTANDLREQCPICLEDATSIPQFSAHLAHHMERIAIFSIPRGLDDGGLMSLASFKAVPRSMSDRTSISLGFSSLASKNSTKDVDPVLDGGIPFNDDRTGASPTPGSDTEAKAKLVTRENLDRTALDLANDPDELQVLTVTQDTLSESIQEQRNNILESTANRTIASNVSVQGPTAHSSDLSSQDHSGSAKDEIVAWLQSFASLRMSNLSYMPLETGEYQRFLEDPSFVSWCTGSRPRRIVCYGLDDVRNTMFTSMIYDHLTQNLPEVPIVLCQMPGPFPRDLEAKDILTSILGQLIAHKSVETIPTELLRLYGGHELPREELSKAAVVQLLELTMSMHTQVYFVLDGYLKQQVTRKVHSMLASLNPQNLKILLSTTSYHDPVYEVICDRCDKETTKYWHCSTCNGGDFDVCLACRLCGFDCLDTSHKQIAFDASKDQAIFDIDQIFEMNRPTRSFSGSLATQIFDLQKDRLAGLEQRPALLGEVYRLYHNVISNSIMRGEHKNLAMISFEIISHAIWPMSKSEFEHTLRFICKTRGLQSENRWNVAGAILATGCLIVGQHDSIRFFQTSLFTYFGKTRNLWFPSGHADLARACLTTLMSHDPHTFMDASQAASSLFAYAARAWGRHVCACSSDHDIEVLAFKYLTDPDRLQVGNRVAYDMRAPGFEEVSGFGPLHVCSIFGLKSLINRLLVTNPDIGAEVDSQTHTRSMTPLMYAASVGHLETLVLLLEQGANPYLTNAEGSTAMFEALMNRRHDVLMHFLTSTTIEPHTVTSGGIRHTALMHIRFFTSIESVRALLGRQDIDVNESDEQGFTVLSHILFDPKPRQPGWTVDVARLILAVPGFETHAVDKMHRSYIQQLLQSPGFDEDLLEILLATDVDLENRDRAGETAIFYAICNQPKTKAAHMLLEHGANMTVRNYADTGLIHVGYYMDESDAMSSVRALLELVPDCINDQDSWGRTALHRALFLGQMELTRVLLTYTPDVEIRDNYGRTAFDVACQYGRFDVPDHDDADWLPSKKSTPDQTALSEAQLTPRGTLSPLPLPAWSLAFTWDLAQLRQKFKDGKLDMLEASPDDQNTALHLLMTSDPETTNTLKEILEVHFKTSNECSPRNIEGETPLHIAIQKNNIEIAKILIRNSADLQVQDSSGKTPLDLAKALERSAITTLIRQVLDDVSDSPK